MTTDNNRPSVWFRRIVHTHDDLVSIVRGELADVRKHLTAGNAMASETAPFGERLRAAVDQMDIAVSEMRDMRDKLVDEIRMFDNEFGGVWE